ARLGEEELPVLREFHGKVRECESAKVRKRAARRRASVHFRTLVLSHFRTSVIREPAAPPPAPGSAGTASPRSRGRRPGWPRSPAPAGPWRCTSGSWRRDPP